MPKKERMPDEQKTTIAREIIDLLRSYHPAIFEAREILDEAKRLLNYVVIREKVEE